MSDQYSEALLKPFSPQWDKVPLAWDWFVGAENTNGSAPGPAKASTESIDNVDETSVPSSNKMYVNNPEPAAAVPEPSLSITPATFPLSLKNICIPSEAPPVAPVIFKFEMLNWNPVTSWPA